jgi:hypothetical protein
MHTQNNKSKKTKYKNEIDKSLADVGLTYDEAVAWLNNAQQEMADCSTTCENPFKCMVEGCSNSRGHEEHEATNEEYVLEENEAEEEETSGRSNVFFVPGDDTVSTAVYVDGVKITGVIKAKLSYDGDFGIPKLKLTILGANIR